jgi:hypothetical protein
MGELQELKERVNEQHQREVGIKEGMQAFIAQYEQYIKSLDQQRRELEREVRGCRYRIEHFDDEEILRDDDAAEWEEPSAEAPEIEDSHPDSPADPMQNNRKDEKIRIRRYFARIWHPDKRQDGIEDSPNLMAQVNAAFEESTDAAEMLITVPWDNAWVERQPDETIGDQWERLIEWQAHLSTAKERLARRLHQLTHDWRYPLYQQWRAASNEKAYFSALAKHERDEIRRLKRTLTTLQRKLEQVELQADKEADE